MSVLASICAAGVAGVGMDWARVVSCFGTARVCGGGATGGDGGILSSLSTYPPELRAGRVALTSRLHCTPYAAGTPHEIRRV